MVAVKDKPILAVDDVAGWEAFMEANPDHDGVRLRLRKKASVQTGITYAEALDAALCFGWIDGQAGALDQDYHLQVFGPRRRRSVWSKRNQEHIERLTAAGRMRPLGQAQVDQARADGRWDAAYRQKDAEVPDDLQAALDANSIATTFFNQLSSQDRFAILFRIGNVKRAETRATKIATYVAMLERGETIYPARTEPSPSKARSTTKS
jgi:uncharacterized protein YdeI (YjbR/CyaY-like superfamily)